MKKILSIGEIYMGFWSNSFNDGFTVTEIIETKNIIISLPYTGKIIYSGKEYNINDYDAVVIFSVDRMSKYLYSIIKDRCKVIGNPYSRVKMKDKVAGAIELSKRGIPIVKTLYSSSYIKRDISSKLSSDIVVKPKDGSFGRGVVLYRNNSINDVNNRIVQPYIECNASDERLIVVDGKCVCAISRKATDPNEFRSNVCIGGTAEAIEITDEMQELGKKVFDCFPGCIWMGIDVLKSVDGEIYVGEVNHYPHNVNETLVIDDFYEKIFVPYIYDYIVKQINES